MDLHSFCCVLSRCTTRSEHDDEEPEAQPEDEGIPESDACVCMVCRMPCSTRACQCSYLHKQCAREHAEQLGPTCRTCGTRLRLHGLEAKPKRTAEEREIARQQREVAQRRAMEAAVLTRSWPHKVWPVIRVMYSERVGVRTALNRIMRDDVHAFCQRCLDSGLASPEQALIEIAWVESKYDLLPSRMQQRLQHQWADAKPADLSW